MINYIYQLVSPKIFTQKYENLEFHDEVLIRPEYLAICHADMRYYMGQRDPEVLAKKLPMALIHECCGTVVADPSGTFNPGDSAVLLPNIPAKFKTGKYENYESDGFRSSGIDGFMREYVTLPADRVVPSSSVSPGMAITEFVSVAFHAASRLMEKNTTPLGRIGVWGDGNLGYVTALVLKYLFPEAELVVMGKDRNKLSHFSFAKTYSADAIPPDLTIDHAFECVGSSGCAPAIDGIIRHIAPQGTVVLMGVSELHVPINTRDVLEKGLTLVGSSRSRREDFESAVAFMEREDTKRRLSLITSEVITVRNMEDIHKAFSRNLINPYKTIMEWNI